MEPLSAAEVGVGAALLFFVPGFAVAKAVFPERRVSGPDGVRWAIELVTLAFVLSVVLTVTLGYVLLAGSSGGFSATWSNPLLEATLAAVTVVAVVVGGLEGAYARVAPRRVRLPAEPGTEGAWELSERLDRLQRERWALERDLRELATPEGDDGRRLRAQIDRLLKEEEALREAREAEYDQ